MEYTVWLNKIWRVYHSSWLELERRRRRIFATLLWEFYSLGKLNAEQMYCAYAGIIITDDDILMQSVVVIILKFYLLGQN